MDKLFAFLLAVSLFSCGSKNSVNVYYDTHSAILSYGTSQLSESLEKAGYTAKLFPHSDTPEGISVLSPLANLNENQQAFFRDHIADIKHDGYKIIKKKGNIYVIGHTERGCLYGMMDIAEQLEQVPDLAELQEKQINPALAFRAIKFNLPWSPYRNSPATILHTETCQDLAFWEAYLDMMVKNRFNALTLWNKHPFTNMIKAQNFPAATPLNDQALQTWQSFWKKLFKMAKDRGIETYMVNWNIVVSPEFAEAYGAKEYFDRSELVKKYTRESVTQLIDEYEDLTGLGVTLADWMGNWGEEKMTPAEREAWIAETFVEGMAHADRKIKFIHRAVLAGDPEEMRKVIDKARLPDKTIVEVKFNWSHGHSTPKLSLTHANDDGTIMRGFWDPMPENYFLAWMIRNEDFFVLRWGDPEFIRAHIQTNNHEYVDGYFVGSEGYIPAKDYSHIEPHPHKTWKYAFEKQWLFYHLWGRLLYNPNETDKALAAGFRERYQNTDAISLLEAHTLSAKVPEHIASFYKATWDYTLYSEGFMSVVPIGYDDKKSPFISIAELIQHETLDSRYLNIVDYVDIIHAGKVPGADIISPLELAQSLENNCKQALSIVNRLHATDNEPALDSELDDIATWCHLGFYFADKLRAGVALQTFHTQQQAQDQKRAEELLEKCLAHWKKVIELTAGRYQKMPYVSMALDGAPEQQWGEAMTSFHWSNFLKDVEADLAYVRDMGREK